MNILHNIPYLLMLIALVVKDILFLRAILTFAQIIMILYSFLVADYVVTFWNSVFVLINIVRIVMILRDRKPIKLETENLEIYQQFFSIMTRKEFLHFWRLGDRLTSENAEMIIRTNEKLNKLMFIISGKVSVRKNTKEIAILKKGNFLAEMSLLTGEYTSADVVAIDKVNYMSWSDSDIKKIELETPELWNRILASIGKDLAEKVKMASIK